MNLMEKRSIMKNEKETFLKTVRSPMNLKLRINKISTTPTAENTTQYLKSEEVYCKTSSNIDFDSFIKNRRQSLEKDSQCAREIDFTAEEEKYNKIQNNLVEDAMNTHYLISKLDSWDTEHVFEPNLKSRQMKLNKTSGVESILKINEIKHRISQFNLFKMNPKIKNYIKRSEIDQKSIFLQNINLSKTKFNFDVLSRDSNIYEKNQSLKINKHSSQRKSELSFEQFLFTSEEIQNQNAFDNVTSIEHYREIIRRKSKEESEHRKEILNRSKQFFEKKIEKEKLLKKRLELINEFQIYKEEIKLQIDAMTKKIERLKMSDTSPQKKTNMFKKMLSSLIVGDGKLSSLRDFEEEVQKTKNICQQKKIQVERKCESIMTKTNELNLEIKLLKIEINSLTNQQITYYLNILKDGIDVRYEGLSWVVKRLFELNAHLDQSKFPSFLDSNQVEYLIEYSKKCIENSHYKIILKTLKNRQRKIRDEKHQKLMKSLKTFLDSPNNDYLFNTNILGNTNSLSPQTVMIFKDLFGKDDLDSHKISNEESAVKKIVTQIKGYKSTTFNLFSKEENTQTNEDKAKFEDLFALRESIRKTEEEIRQLRASQMQIFKSRNEIFRLKKESMEYEILYAALFGNGIIV
jgi:hypothetical protein